MAKIDPALRFLAHQEPVALRALAIESVFELVDTESEQPGVNALIEFSGDINELEVAGFKTEVSVGNVAAGTIDLARLPELESLPELTRIEVSRALYKELDLARPQTRAFEVHVGPPGHRGAGVLIGIIDSGIDYTHEAFRRSDGTTRVVAIWDQALQPQGEERPPAGFSFGVEYQRAAIDEALRTDDPLQIVRHVDRPGAGGGFHGTHVCGISAGDGSVAGAGHPSATFVGIAPEAELVLVANNRGRTDAERGMGDSADVFAALTYIFQVAESLGRPVVINQSQGDNVGPHDGSSILERGIDGLLGGPGRAMVKSAGNEGALNRHASGTVPKGGSQDVQFTVPGGRMFQLMMDIWYRGADRLDFSLTTPGGDTSETVSPGTEAPNLVMQNGNRVFVDSNVDDPANHDNRIFVIIQSGPGGTIEPGTWSFRLDGIQVETGQWDAWIQRSQFRDEFLPPLRNPARTISIPGTSREIITAASYVTRGAGVGSISTFSSLGPTRDGRDAPTVAAPGQLIIAPQPIATGDLYGEMQGTSMSAPAVAGAVALLLQKNPTLTQAQIKACLEANARADEFTGDTPNNAWGAGKLDVVEAFGAIPDNEAAARSAEGVEEQEGAGGTGANDTAYWHGNMGY
jgi:subtilisin family serine protease